MERGVSKTPVNTTIDTDNETEHDKTALNDSRDSIELPVHDKFLSPRELYDKYQHEILINGKMIATRSIIFDKLGEKLDKSSKAVYLMLKRAHESSSISQKIEITAKNDESPQSVAPQAETVSSQGVAKSTKEGHGEDISATKSYSKVFDNACIFQTENRSEKHRNKMLSKSCVKSGWTSKLAALLYKELDLSCKFDFKKAWLVADVVHTKAKCDCGARLDVTSDLETIQVNVTGVKTDFKHTKKYSVKGELKEQAADLLKHKNAEYVRMKLVHSNNPNNEELLGKFDPLTPALGSLREQKRRQKSTSLDPVSALLNMMSNEHKDEILAIGQAPFYVIYRTTLQHAWYIMESKKGPISISIDATGSLVIPPSQSQKIGGRSKLKHIYLYSIVVKTGGKSVPIAQMLSQDQSSEFIEYCLRKLFKNVCAPREIVCDESKALLKALSSVFGKAWSLNDYVNQCMSAVLKGADVPPCYLRLDRSHFVKNLTRNIKDRDFRRRQFFLGVIGYLIQCNNFDAAKEIIRDFFTVILNRFDGADVNSVELDDTGKQKLLPAEISKQKLLRLITTYDETDYGDEDTKLEDTDLNIDVDCTWIQQIIAEVIIFKGEKGWHENLYYSAGDKDLWAQKFSTIALWSNVMNKEFRSASTVATSSDVESTFKSLKRSITQGKRMGVNTFVSLHIEYVNAEVKLNAGSVANDEGIQKRKRSNSLQESPPKARCKRSKSIHCDYYNNEPVVNGKTQCLDFYILSDILQISNKKHKYISDSHFQTFLKLQQTLDPSKMS